MKKVLSVAGSDCSGGAGIQADIKTVAAHGMYAMSVITSLTAQNTMGVSGILDTPPEFIGKQLDAVFCDICPDAVKTGMVGGSENIRVISEKFRKYGVQNIVVDPVMVSTSGSRLLREDAVDALSDCLIPLARVVTPNIPEAEVLCGIKIENEEDMRRAAELISKKTGCAVLVKGGHRVNDATDILFENGEFSRFSTLRVDNPNTHGTGCTLSSAIACGLADGKNLSESIMCAKEYLTGALKAQLNLGKGSGPLNHMYKL